MLLINGYKPIAYAWKHAFLTYDDIGKWKPETQPLLKGSKYLTFSNDTDFAFAAIYKDHVVFSFEGTANIKGWISDLDVYPLKGEEYLKKNLKSGKWGDGIIHDGFYTDWIPIKVWVDSIVTDHKLVKRKKKIICTGHSRGSAFSELCARHLAKNHSIPSSCFTFGSPMIGTKEYRDEFRSLPINGTRVCNGWDLIYYLPPKILGFRHGCANEVRNKKPFWRRFIPRLRINDHLNKNYDKFITKRFINK